MEANCLLVGVLSTPSYGAGVRLAPDALIDDGLLQVVLMEDVKLWEVLKLLPWSMWSGEPRPSRLKRWNVRRVGLRRDRPSLFHGDGEILGPTPVEIEVVPNAVRVLAPPK